MPLPFRLLKCAARIAGGIWWFISIHTISISAKGLNFNIFFAFPLRSLRLGGSIIFLFWPHRSRVLNIASALAESFLVDTRPFRKYICRPLAV